MKRALTAIALVVIVFLSSCKKDKTLENQQERQFTSFKTNKPTSSTVVFNYKASEATLKANTQSLVNAFKAGNVGGTALRPGFCPTMAKSTSILSRVSDTCGGVNTTLVYQVSVIELPAYTYQLNYSFALAPSGPLFYIPGTFTPPTDTILCPDWNLNGVAGECPLLKVFEVTFVMYRHTYIETNSTTIEITATCQQPGSTPTKLYNNVSLEYSCTEYLNSPAIIYINNPAIGLFNVESQCGIACPNPHFICPNGGTFNFRLAGSSNSWQSISIPALGSFYNQPAAPGIYEYSCTLNYNCGTSLPATGTFQVF